MQVITEAKDVKQAAKAKRRTAIVKGLLGMLSICCLVCSIFTPQKELANGLFVGFILLALIARTI